ncbi:MAG TPA: DUF1570 domain-containing protein [Lacipirellulaceae bacterium]|nr:DUF1570 domain-containing protein [Lacipirellulaceae bacterium]
MRAYPALLLSALAALTGCLSTRPFSAPSPRLPPRAGAEFREPVRAGQLVIHANFHLPAGHRMVSELTSERQLICDRLQIPAGAEPIQVYLFAEEADYRAHVAAQYPEFPARRAIFVETDVQLTVYAHWSDRVAEDLRHEVAHGYLHSTVPNLPLWLDEGLAEYFEVGRGKRGLNRGHLEFLRAQQAAAAWQPDLGRLELLSDAATMSQGDYAEAWLWVHYLLESPTAPPLLPSYLKGLRAGDPVPTLSSQLGQGGPAGPAAQEAIVAHLQSLAL